MSGPDVENFTGKTQQKPNQTTLSPGSPSKVIDQNKQTQTPQSAKIQNYNGEVPGLP